MRVNIYNMVSKSISDVVAIICNSRDYMELPIYEMLKFGEFPIFVDDGIDLKPDSRLMISYKEKNEYRSFDFSKILNTLLQNNNSKFEKLIIGLYRGNDYIIWGTNSNLTTVLTHSFNNLTNDREIYLRLREYNYRYIFIIQNNDKEETSPEEIIYPYYFAYRLCNGSWDKQNNKREINFLLGSSPCQLSLKYKIDKNDVSVYYFFSEIEIINIFNKFYGAHPDTKTDFIIKIDIETNNYQLALFRQGLKEPVVIPESAYQLIVFKNKFEYYRSENYYQPRGAWIW